MRTPISDHDAFLQSFQIVDELIASSTPAMHFGVLVAGGCTLFRSPCSRDTCGNDRREVVRRLRRNETGAAASSCASGWSVSLTVEVAKLDRLQGTSGAMVISLQLRTGVEQDACGGHCFGC